MKKIEVLIILFGILFLLIPLIFAKVYINEVEVDPQTDWDSSGSIGSSDEWIELYNDGLSFVNLGGWNLSLIDGTDEIYLLSGTIAPQSYLIILNPPGQQNNDGWITLKNNTGSIIDSVTYGSYNDGDVSDNAPSGNSDNIDDECLARIPNGFDTNIDKDDFTKIKCTFNLSNRRIINVPDNYATIQDAINAARKTDIINVSAGVYTEELLINKDNLTIISSDPKNTIIDLNQPSETTGIAIYANNTIFEGFTVVNISKVSNHAQYAIRVRGERNKILNNIIIGQITRDWWNDEEDSGINLDGTTSIVTANNLIENNEIYNFSGMGIQVVGSGGNYNSFNNTIKNNKIQDIDYYAITINRSANNIIENNFLINIGPSGHLLEGVPAVGVIIFGAKSSGTKIINQNINGTEVGIALSSTQNIKIERSKVIGNSVRGIQISYASWLGDIPDNNSIINSTIADNNVGILIRQGSGSIGLNNKINFNDITNNTIGINNTSPTNISAEYNWWGLCDPSSIIFGSVNFRPWIGTCIINKTTDKSCIFQYDNIVLYANVSSQVCIGNIWFGININGIWKNYTASLSNSGIGNYSLFLDKGNFTGGENISWTVYADDCYSHTTHDGNPNFYVNKRTVLEVNKSNPDGLNGWYVTEPLFSLIKDSSLGNVYYKWDSSGSILYTGVFGLEDIPNPPKESAGILELNWWTDFVICGNEKEQNQTFKIDLTSPLIKNLIPANNSIVYNNAKPTIEAYLDEVYQSNSGINKNTVLMKLDEQNVSANVFNADTLDAIVRYNPVSNLAEGWHKISVYVEDNAGRKTNLNWSFYVNLSIPLFNLSVYSPLDKIYGDKKIIFNITTSDIVSKIEFINWNDKNQEWNILCRNCDEYGNSRKKLRTVNENWNNITIRAVDFFGNYKELNISFFADSKEPVISNIFPSKNKITNGSDFYIKYSENNLKEILLNWNPSENLTHCNESGKNKECYAELNLSSYDGEYINFWFNVSDVFRTIQSKVTIVKVDTTSPILIINLPENKTGNESYGFRVPFNLSVSEKVLLEYYDKLDSNSKWKKLCVNCDNYGLIKTKNKFFKKGAHDIFIRAIDKASNSDIKEVKFEVV